MKLTLEQAMQRLADKRGRISTVVKQWRTEPGGLIHRNIESMAELLRLGTQDYTWGEIGKKSGSE